MLSCTDHTGIEVSLDPEHGCRGFFEGRSYRFSVFNTEHRLFIDEVLIPFSSDAEGNFCLWRPGFFSGEVALEVMDLEDRCVLGLRLRVEPHQAKLERDEFVAMLDDLFEYAPHLIYGTESAEHAVGIRGSSENIHLQYARLRIYGPSFVEALRAITAKPLTRLVHERALQPLHRIRHVDQQTLRSIGRNASVMNSLVQDAEIDSRDALFDVRHSYLDVNHPANQAMFHMLRAIRRRIVHVLDSLETQAAKEVVSDTRTPMQPRMARRRQVLAGLQQSLQRIEKTSAFSEQKRCELSAAGLNAISAHPIYARAYRLAWSALRTGQAGHEGSERLWLSPTWEIYERWCFWWLSQQLKRMFPSLDWKVTNPRDREDCLEICGRHGVLSVTVWLQALFSAWDQSTTQDRRSLSGRRYPDIVVTAENGARRKFLVFDAKYRTERTMVLDAMASAHLYHDCLRWKGEKPCRSVLLVPRAGGAEWMEKLEFIAEHGVGVLPLAPGTENHQVQDLLTSELSSFLSDH